MLRKFISALLAVVIVTSTFTTMTVSATEQSPVSLSNNDVSVQGENSFGDMLSGKIEDAMAQETTSADFALTGLKIEDKTATVEYMSAVDCTILVALYDEATNKMVASGKSVVSSEEDVATITIETEEMPKYFVATAYMLDSNNAPLTDEFTTELYTEEIQMVKAMKATDFEEDRVLKLEDTDETNFAVYSEDTKVIEYKENYNIPVTIDDENGVYVFSNANDDLKSLVKGDMIAYEYSADNIIILKVDTIKIDGDTVTITEGDAELEDVFDYVKIEASLDEGECEVNMDGIDDGIQLVDKPSSVSSKAPSSVGAIDEEVSYFHETSFKFLDVSCIFGEIKFGITSTLNVYISLDKADIDFTVEYSLVGTVGLEATTEEIELPFAEIKIPLAPAVVLTIVPAVVFEAKASVGLEIEIKGTAGFKATKKGVKLKDLSLETDSSLKIQGEVFFGLQFEPSLDILDKDIASAGIPITAGMRFQAVNKEYEANHLCVLCFEGEASEELYVSAEIKLTKKRLLSEKTGIKRKLFDFYFSTDFLDTGKGKCPHSEYPIDIYVTKDGKPYSSAEVWIYDGGTYAKMEGITDSNGKLTVTLPYGLYTADVDGELVSFLSHKSTEKVEINVVGATEPTTTEPTTTQPTEPETEPTEPEKTEPYIIDSGVCGDNLTWKLYETGLLNITGTGDMSNYDYAPWYSYRNFISKVSIDYGVTRIGDEAFYHCTSLTEITIPDSVTSIGNYAFGYCESLTEITIPNSVTRIGWDAFCCCTSLKKIIIPNSVSSIGFSAFKDCTSLTEITIPDSVTSIRDSVFEGCTNLREITIPDSVTSIGEYAFYRCISLTEITIPDSVTSIGDGSFSYCTILTEITIPDSVTSIADGVFHGCTGLSEIIIPDSVTSIGGGAFMHCESLREITIPDSVTSIRNNAFRYDYSLEAINIDVNNEVYSSVDGVLFDKKIQSLIIYPCGKKNTAYTIPNSATSIGDGAFDNCTGLTEITIPNSVTSIGWDAFSWCTSLKKIIIPDSVTSIGGSAFYDCTSLREITIPDSVTSIGNGAFACCESLTEITIPDSVTSIDYGAFMYCESLREIRIPDSVTSIGENAFYNCTSLTDVYIYGNPGLGYRAFPSHTKIHYMNDESTESVSSSYTTSKLINSSSASVAEFDNLIAGGDYIVAVVKSEGAEDLLSADNLLYIEQVTADESGNVSLEYVPRESVENPVVLIFGAERMSILDVEVTALKDEGSQVVEYTVTLNGAVLTENTDYELVADDESVTINGINNYKDSITLTIVPMLIGDVNQDNMININDTTYIMKYLAELESFNDTQKLVADTNGDGAVTITDATQIQKYLASLITSFN